ncbi:helix-turn-helix domain-containing protein [bacterium]|nr:helix-turn-helix domain-containing protein [bacterium]
MVSLAKETLCLGDTAKEILAAHRKAKDLLKNVVGQDEATCNVTDSGKSCTDFDCRFHGWQADYCGQLKSIVDQLETMDCHLGCSADYDLAVQADVYNWTCEFIETGWLGEQSFDASPDSRFEILQHNADLAGVSAREYAQDQAEDVLKALKAQFPKLESIRQKAIGRIRWDESKASDENPEIPYIEGTDPFRYHGVKEKKVKRVGKPLEYPNDFQSTYGMRSNSVGYFVVDHLVQESGVKASVQVVLNFLLRHVNSKGYVSTPMELISGKTNLDRKTISRGIQTLVDCGIIEIVQKGNNLKKLANKYRITLCCASMLGSEEFLAKRWYALTGKTDYDKRWEKYGE